MKPLEFSIVDAPAEWGNAASAGAQDQIRYAFFPKPRRLVIERAGVRTVYDTAGHIISGIAQDQSDLREHRTFFTSPEGVVPVESLVVVKSFV